MLEKSTLIQPKKQPVPHQKRKSEILKFLEEKGEFKYELRPKEYKNKKSLAIEIPRNSKKNIIVPNLSTAPMY